MVQPDTSWGAAWPARGHRSARRLAGVSLALLLGACTTPAEYSAAADLEVDTLLAETRDTTLGGREAWVIHPLPAATGDAATDDAALTGTPAAPGAPPEPPLELTLRKSLAIAVTTSREFLNAKDSLYLQGLGLTLTRYDFGPLVNSTIAFLWSDAKNGASSSRLGWGADVSQILPSGGTFTLGGTLAALHTGGSSDVFADPTYDSNLAFGLNQPLLRGSGYEVSHEALTQGERNVIYAVRDFEIFRENFSIDIAQSFFDLVSQKQRLVNLEQNFKEAQFDETKAEALRQVDRNRDEDVFLARRRVINAETELLSARTSYDAAVDAFKIRLGLTTATVVTIADEEPPFESVRLDPDSAVEVALHNRLDLITAAQRLEDSERSVRIARDGLRADLGLVATYGLQGTDDNLLSSYPADYSTNVGLTLGLPIDRQSERNNYRSAQIAFEREQRDYSLLVDNTARDILDQLRQLERQEQQIELQKQQIEQELRAVAVTEIRYEAGDVDNRDLLDARQSLVEAQNLLIVLTASHFIARLALLRDLGLLFIDDQGMWKA